MLVQTVQQAPSGRQRHPWWQETLQLHSRTGIKLMFLFFAYKIFISHKHSPPEFYPNKSMCELTSVSIQRHVFWNNAAQCRSVSPQKRWMWMKKRSQCDTVQVYLEQGAATSRKWTEARVDGAACHLHYRFHRNCNKTVCIQSVLYSRVRGQAKVARKAVAWLFNEGKTEKNKLCEKRAVYGFKEKGTCFSVCCQVTRSWETEHRPPVQTFKKMHYSSTDSSANAEIVHGARKQSP